VHHGFDQLSSPFWYHEGMKKANVSATKKRIGRPPTGIGTQIGMRWHESALAEIDAWRVGQPGLPSRTEAIRRLVELGLKAKGKAR